MNLNFAALIVAIVEALLIQGFPKIRGTLAGGPHHKDYSILGSTWGSPYFEKLSYKAEVESDTKPKTLEHSGLQLASKFCLGIRQSCCLRYSPMVSNCSLKACEL